MEYRFTTALAVRGDIEQQMETLLEAFLAEHPETGPVASGNLEASTVSITFALSAASLEEAWQSGSSVFSAGMTAAGIATPDDVLRVEVESVTAEQAHEAELQLA